MRTQGKWARAGRARWRLGVPLAVLAAAAAMTLGAAGTASAAPAGGGGPTCPEGSTYNKKTKVCERNPTVVCPTGTSYEPSTGLCAGSSARYNCVEGYTYNASSEACEAPGCPENYSYLASIDRCWSNDTQPQAVDPACPPGPDGVAVEFVHYTSENYGGYCTYSPPPTCDPGLAYDSGSGRCVAVPQYTCPQGYGYNTLTGKCQTAPTKGTKT